jgi:MFS family permease
MATVAAAALLLSQAHDEPWQVLLASGLLGAGVGAAFAAMVALIAENVDPRAMGVATGMNTVVRLVGSVVGGQVGAALLTSQTILGTSLPSESAFAWAFGLSALAAAAAALVAFSIRPSPLRVAVA